MNLSRKWLSEFVSVEADDKEFAESMTLSGSKVELTHDLGAEIQNVVVGKVLSMEHHPDSDHMWVCQIDVGREEPVQIVTGAWNVHIDDLVPVAMHKSTLPGGKKIEKGKLRGVVSNGMLCGLSELGLDTRDFPYAVITPAAILGDYKPLDKDKPSISADIQPGDKIYGPVVCAKVLQSGYVGAEGYSCGLDIGGSLQSIFTPCPNLHEGDLVAYDTKRGAVCTLDDLHAQQAEFPHCIPDGIFILHEDCKPGDDLKPVVGLDDHVVEFEITPNRPDCLSIIGLAREASATFDAPLALHQPVVKGRPRRAAGAAGCGDPGGRPVPPIHRPNGAQREDRSLPKVDAGAAAGHGRAPHQQHRGHHQLRHAGVRPAHACLRLPLCEGRQDRGPPGGGGRGAHHPGRKRA